MKKQDEITNLTRLPLIDFGLTPSAKLIRGREFYARVLWLIHLRWVAVVCLMIGLALGQRLMGVRLLSFPLIILTFILAFYNLIAHIISRNFIRNSDYALHISAYVQISMDLLLLTLLLHYSGGIENPFILSYVYHMIIAAILLTAWAAYAQAIFASVLIGILIVLTQSGFLNQPHIPGFMTITLYDQKNYVWTFYIVFVCTLFLVVYMTYSISKELKAREDSLAKTNLMLQEKDRLKSEYVLALSHDLKQPIAAVQTNLRVILDGYAGDISETASSMIEKSEKRLLQLLNVISDLLKLSKITAQRTIEKQEIEFGKIINEIVQRVAELAHDKNQVLDCSTPPQGLKLKANAEMLKQSIWNIVENAIKYTPPDGKIKIEAKQQENCAEIIIEDTGIGIPPEEVDSVFDDFYRAKNARQLVDSGTGLGLAVVKHVVGMHEGKIEITSPIPERVGMEYPGTRITICLPTISIRKES